MFQKKRWQWCWWLKVCDVMVTEVRFWRHLLMLVVRIAKAVINILNMSPTHFVPNIRHQYRFYQKIKYSIWYWYLKDFTWLKIASRIADVKTIKHWLCHVVKYRLVDFPICPMRFIESIQTNPNTIWKFQFEEIFMKIHFKRWNQGWIHWRTLFYRFEYIVRSSCL